MEKIKVALLLSGYESFGDHHVIESIGEYLPDERFELKLIKIDTQNPGKTVQELQDYKPLFTMDFNTKGIIWGEKDGKRIPFYELLGSVHFSFFTEDPVFHASNLMNMKEAVNTVLLITDLRYGEFLSAFGFQNIFYFTPCVNLRLFPAVEEKDLKLVFAGDLIDPNLIIETWKRNMDDAVRDFALEVGEFCFRNPEVAPMYATDYLLPLMNPEFQETFNRFRQEDPLKFFNWLAQVELYTTARRNAFILGFLEGTELTVVGRVEGPLPEGMSAAELQSPADKLSYLARSQLAITAFPAFVPSGIGFTPLEIAAAEAAPMVNFRSTLPGFFKPEEEVIVYNPLDRMDIEEKLLFYLENDEDRRLIAQNAFKAVKERFTCADRVQFFKELMNSVYEQIAQQKQAEENKNQNLN